MVLSEMVKKEGVNLSLPVNLNKLRKLIRSVYGWHKKYESRIDDREKDRKRSLREVTNEGKWYLIRDIMLRTDIHKGKEAEIWK